MKNTVLLLSLLFMSLSTTLMAHDLRNSEFQLRRWELTQERKNLEGSFLFFKDGNVYIQTANHSVVEYPISSFSKEDQQWIAKKNAEINQLNQQSHHSGSKSNSLSNTSSFILISLLLLILSYIMVFVEQKKMRYSLSFLVLGACIGLFSFTNKSFKSLLMPSSPATLDSAFAPFKPNVSTFWDANYFYVESKGIPTTHAMMVGISNHGWQRQVPIPQCYIKTNSWPIPLNPVMANNPIPVDSIHFTRGAIAIAVNGVPIFNVHTNTGVDSYLDGQLDNFGGHCGRADDYHYHIAPLHLYQYTGTNLPVAYGLDGYAVYGSVEPDGTAMRSLDANHGHLYNGTYHYHGTTTAPYMIARMAGQVTEDNTHQLIPQAAAKGVRPALTPLNGALITACTPNANQNGYNVTYTRNGVTDSVVYSWSQSGVYTFKFYTGANLDSTKNYNGFIQCTIPINTGVNELENAQNDFSVYPNPTQGKFKIDIQNEAAKNKLKQISIFDLNGKLIYKTTRYPTEIELDKSVKGIYFIQIQFDQQYQIQKLIIE